MTRRNSRSGDLETPPGVNSCASSAVGRVELEVASDLALPAVAVREQPVLVVVKFLPRLDGELDVRPLDDGVHWARLLAEAAVDALHHVDVVAGGAAAAVVARLGLDGDRLRRADRLAKLAGDAALLAVGIAPQGMLAAKAGRLRPALVG